MYLFFPLFFSAAGSTLGLHYESIIEAGQHFPIPVICGEHRPGETKTARVALRLMDNRSTGAFYSTSLLQVNLSSCAGWRQGWHL